MQGSKSAPNVLSHLANTKDTTEQTMKLMQMYKDLGDYEGQVGTASSTTSSSRTGCVHRRINTPSPLLDQ